MTRDDVIRLAQEIGLELYSGPEGNEMHYVRMWAVDETAD